MVMKRVDTYKLRKYKARPSIDYDDPEQVTELLRKTVEENNATMTKEKAIAILSRLSMYDENGQLKEC